MKSLLVDALRQARNLDEDKVLSDSGSFDTTQSEFLATANDAVVESSDAETQELALYETINRTLAESVVLEATPEVMQHVELPSTSISVVCAPRQSKFAPIICVVAAVISAGLWLGYQQFRPGYSESAMNMPEELDSTEHVERMSAMHDQPDVSRFSFLPPNVTAETQETRE